MAEPFVCHCPHCQTALRLKDDGMVGKKVRCPRCSNVFQVPPAGTTAAPSPVRPAQAERPPAPVAPRPTPRPAAKADDRQDEDDSPRRPARAARQRDEEEDEEDRDVEKRLPVRKSSGPQSLIIGAIVGVVVLVYFVLILAFKLQLLGAAPPKPHTLPSLDKRADRTPRSNGHDPVRALSPATHSQG
jgi:predicted Zn finger-like uncharacterized protein